MSSLSILIKFIVLGIVQGLTEPLPISSSGHLVLLREFFNVNTPGLTFEVLVHLGSLLAIMMLYRRDILQLAKGSYLYITQRNKQHYQSFQFSMYLIVATMITGVIGLAFEEVISTALSKVLYVGIAFLVTGFFIWLIQHKHGHKTAAAITWKDAIIIGACQALALIPGISRSGTTIVAGMLLGLNRQTTLRFSFLLFIPVGLGINLLSAKDIYQSVLQDAFIIPYIVAFLAATIATYYALKFFITIMMQGKLIFFSLYCFILGITIVLSQW